MKIIYAVAATLILGVTYAAADPGGEGNNTGCNGQGNPNSPCEPSNGNGGNGGSSEVNNNVSSESTAVAGAISGSYSNSDSTSISGGGSAVSNVGVTTGGATSGSTSSATGGSGGHASASGGNSTANSGDSSAASSNEGNTVQLEAQYADGDTEVSVQDNSSVSFSQEYEGSAGSAATVFAGYCQTGGSGQTVAGGFSVVNPEQFCNHIRMAAVFKEAYEHEIHKQCHQIDVGFTDRGGEEQITATKVVCGDMEQASEYLALYKENLAEANNMLDTTEAVAKVDAVAGYLVRPLAILALLLLL